MRTSLVMLLAFSGMLAASAQAAAPNLYAGEQARSIKALTPEEIDGYLSGKGMGQAKAAELNDYPGPAHVLALANELQLSTTQRKATELLFKEMEAKAMEAGQRLIDEELRLDQLFATKAVTTALLAQSLSRIGELQAAVRQTHLETHLAQHALLTSAQIARYAELRGYAAGVPSADSTSTPKHH